MRGVGLPVELTIEGEPRPLPAGVDLSAYRIVQEALTNTLKHARPAHARVTVRYRATTSSSRSSTTGEGDQQRRRRPATGSPACASGSRLYGGTLETGERPGAGSPCARGSRSGTA